MHSNDLYILGAYNFNQVNVSGIQIFRAQLLALNLRKIMLDAADIYLFRFILTKCAYIYRSLLILQVCVVLFIIII